MSFSLLYSFGQSIVDTCHSFVVWLSSPVVSSDNVVISLISPFPESFTWWQLFTFTGITIFFGLTLFKWIKNMVL